MHYNVLSNCLLASPLFTVLIFELKMLQTKGYIIFTIPLIRGLTRIMQVCMSEIIEL